MLIIINSEGYKYGYLIEFLISQNKNLEKSMFLIVPILRENHFKYFSVYPTTHTNSHSYCL